MKVTIALYHISLFLISVLSALSFALFQIMTYNKLTSGGVTCVILLVILIIVGVALAFRKSRTYILWALFSALLLFVLGCWFQFAPHDPESGTLVDTTNSYNKFEK